MSTCRLPERLTLAEAATTLASLRRDAPEAVDASALRDFDSSAIAVLLELRREAQGRGQRLRVLNWPQRLSDLTALYGVHELFAA